MALVWMFVLLLAFKVEASLVVVGSSLLTYLLARGAIKRGGRDRLWQALVATFLVTSLVFARYLPQLPLFEPRFYAGGIWGQFGRALAFFNFFFVLGLIPSTVVLYLTGRSARLRPPKPPLSPHEVPEHPAPEPRKSPTDDRPCDPPPAARFPWYSPARKAQSAG